MPTAQLRDIVMYYEEAGSGDPLVLIMGLGGDLQAWALQVPALSKHFRVITFDNRGAGRTSSPDRPYSIAGMADDTVRLMDQLGIAKAHVLGFSMGGYIAQELALAYPDRVNKLILLCTAPDIDGYGRAVVRSWIDVRRSSMSREQVVRHTSVFLYSPGLMNDQARYERSIQNSLANPWAQQDHAFIRQAQAVLQFNAADRLSNLKHETLVVSATDDILVPKRNGERLAQLLPNATYKELPGAHVGCIEYPNEYNSAFLEFLGAGVAKEPAAAAAS
ncbi:MAG: alpha/beta fold hydrolase [Hyphomicrobiales bacterium]